MSKGSLYTGKSTDKATASFISFLQRNNIPKDMYTISRSVTDFGKSNYFKFYDSEYRLITTVRVSDHSVGLRRVFNEESYNSIVKIKPVRDRFLKVVKSYIKK